MNTPYHPPLALRWNRVACDAIYRAKLSPPIAARALAMVHTAMYDAWTAYTAEGCVSTTTGSRLKRPADELTQQNREIAFSSAAYRVLEALLGDRVPAEAKELLEKGLQPIRGDSGDPTLDVKTPQGTGSLSAKLVLDYRRGDGSNQDAGYGDYTDYKPVNLPHPEELTDMEKWQPQHYEQEDVQRFATPHWGLVKPFALEWGGQFRPPEPASKDQPGFGEQARKLIEISACLTEEQKMIAEYWAGMHEDKCDKTLAIPKHGYWTVPPLQCCRLARYVAEKKAFLNSHVIKSFFAVTNGLLDASIAAWDAKEWYDYGRPDSIIRELFDDVSFQAWGGRCRGTIRMEGENWEPYLQRTPPFPEYPSGHSTFTRVTAEILGWYCGASDGRIEYGETVTFPAKSSVIEPECTPGREIRLTWSTLRDAADQAGMSRRYGGIHFEDGDEQGRNLGRCVAQCVWRKADRYFEGVLG